MDRHPLAGVEAKIDRAKQHLDALNGAIETYLDKDPYRFVSDEHTDEHSYRYEIFLEVDEFPPDEMWGPIIGDAVHNLRSALDHLAWELALPETREQTPRRIEFPIFLDDPAQNAEARGRLAVKLACLRPESHALVDAAQPYNTGNPHHPLWLLQALWNTDKHRTLHTAGFLFGTPSDDPENLFGYAGYSFGGFAREGPGENRTPLSAGRGNAWGRIPDEALRANVDTNMQTYKGMALDVSLGPTGADEMFHADYPFAGLPIRQVLRRISAYVETEVIDPLRPLLWPLSASDIS